MMMRRNNDTTRAVRAAAAAECLCALSPFAVQHVPSVLGGDVKRTWTAEEPAP